MPELPEVETTRKGLLKAIEGDVIRDVATYTSALRFPLPDNMHERLAGCKVLHVARRAKYLLIRVSGGQELLVHLGMSGRFQVLSKNSVKPPRQKHDHVIFRTERGYEVRFNDPRRFGFMDLMAATEVNNNKFLRDLGPEPLGNSFNGPVLAKQLYGRRTSIKSALLNQKIVAGLGNIYVCEALYHSNISPKRRAYTIKGARAERLATSIKHVLSLAISAGGSSLRDFRHADGGLGYFQHQFAVYGREHEYCPRCETKNGLEGCIRRISQSGRSTFFCSQWQR
jgi:formamidopyrimidine-DNA glycosylase